jgi:ABC-type transport system substrate-binding protein
LNREFDYLNQVPAPLSDMVLKDRQLRPELAQRGITLSLFPLLQTNYMWMNMEDPVLGGYTKDKVALRRAIALSFNRAEDISILQKGLALPATTPLPPDVLGYDPQFRSDVRYDPALARQLLERFGYKDRDGDGYRETPDGKPLTLVMHTIASTTGRLRDELWRRSLDAIGIRVVFKNDKYTEIIKASRLGKVQMFDTGWVADFPDGENYFQLLYSANIGGANYARFNLAAYDKLYLQSRPLPESPERRRLYTAMTQTILAYTPWVLGIIPLSADVCQPWLKNYKRHPVENTTWRYLDIDLVRRQAGK